MMRALSVWTCLVIISCRQVFFVGRGDLWRMFSQAPTAVRLKQVMMIVASEDDDNGRLYVDAVMCLQQLECDRSRYQVLSDKNDLGRLRAESTALRTGLMQ